MEIFEYYKLIIKELFNETQCAYEDFIDLKTIVQERLNRKNCKTSTYKKCKYQLDDLKEILNETKIYYLGGKKVQRFTKDDYQHQTLLVFKSMDDKLAFGFDGASNGTEIVTVYFKKCENVHYKTLTLYKFKTILNIILLLEVKNLYRIFQMFNV